MILLHEFLKKHVCAIVCMTVCIDVQKTAAQTPTTFEESHEKGQPPDAL